MDIAELHLGEEMTRTDWATKESQIQDDFVWGTGPEALYQMTRAEYKTEPDKIEIKDSIRVFNECFLPKKNTYQNRREFFWTKQTRTETPEYFWRRLTEVKKECNFESIITEKLLISKVITDKKLRDKRMKEKKPEMKKTIEITEQNSNEKKNNKNTIPEALILNREKNRRRTHTKNGRIQHTTEKEVQ